MTAKQYAEALYDSIHQVRPEDHDKVLDNMVKILNDNGDLKLFDQIAAEYQLLENEGKGIKNVEVTSAHPVHSKQIIKDLNKIVGDKVEIKEKIDQSLIGGVIVRVDDTMIDASIKNSLNNLRSLIERE